MAKAERMHINIMNMVQEMVFTSRLPLTFWGNASEYAAYILNRNPNKANEGGISPNETLTKKRPGLNYIVVYGSPWTVHLNTNNTSFGSARERKNQNEKGRWDKGISGLDTEGAFSGGNPARSECWNADW